MKSGLHPLLLFFALAGVAHTGTPVTPPSPPPGTDIWLTDLQVVDGALHATQARNLTARPGYDNQPAFVTDHSLLFTSMDAAGQTDIWRYELATGETAPLLTTPESEYSPTLAFGNGISVVRVAMNGVQQLWTLAPGAERYELLFPMLEGVGYHAWLDKDRVALFMVREPVSELHIANRASGEVVMLAKNIGRSLHAVPGTTGSLAFTEPAQDGTRWIKRLDFAERRITAVAPLLDGSEDFVFLPDGRLLMAGGRALHVRDGESWREFARFDALPGAITRLAVSHDGAQLAMVVAEGE